ncbi:MAG: MBL fold metallo-hydrolase [Candidatus Eisenbacteria bacterium]|nr:MBL fold metallo-hydrolase [Candidatus Eisenbacteria bacterium]
MDDKPLTSSREGPDDRANRRSPHQVPGWVDLGGLEVRELITSRFRLDGGSMYGQVPKMLWNRDGQADESNRIPLVLRSLVIRSGEKILLVDPGMGSRYSSEESARMEIDPAFATLSAILRQAGIEPGQVGDVLLSHLHFDHIGGLASHGPDGETVLELPHARVWVSRVQWEQANAPGAKERRSFREEDLAAIRGNGPHFLDDGVPGWPQISLWETVGHTRGLLVTRVAGSLASVIYPTDLIPMLAHIRLAYTTGFDLWPERLLEEKTAVLEQAARDRSWIVFAHDPRTAAARVAPGKEGYVVAERKEALDAISLAA